MTKIEQKRISVFEEKRQQEEILEEKTRDIKKDNRLEVRFTLVEYDKKIRIMRQQLQKETESGRRTVEEVKKDLDNQKKTLLDIQTKIGSLETICQVRNWFDKLSHL